MVNEQQSKTLISSTPYYGKRTKQLNTYIVKERIQTKLLIKHKKQTVKQN